MSQQILHPQSHVTTNTTSTVTRVTTNTTPTVTHVTTNTAPTVTHVTTNTTPIVSSDTGGVTIVKTVFRDRPPRDKYPRDKYEPEGKLGQYEYGLIASPNGWLDCVIIHEVHIILKRISNGIQGFQRPTNTTLHYTTPTLHPQSVRQFDIMSGPFIQIVHINNIHWVCFSSIHCPPGYVTVYE